MLKRGCCSSNLTTPVGISVKQRCFSKALRQISRLTSNHCTSIVQGCVISVGLQHQGTAPHNLRPFAWSNTASSTATSATLPHTPTRLFFLPSNIPPQLIQQALSLSEQQINSLAPIAQRQALVPSKLDSSMVVNSNKCLPRGYF